MTVLSESLTNFGALWNLVAPLGMGLAILQGILVPTDVIYFQMLPATLVDCLRGSVPSRVMRGPLVLALKGAPHSEIACSVTSVEAVDISCRGQRSSCMSTSVSADRALPLPDLACALLPALASGYGIAPLCNSRAIFC